MNVQEQSMCEDILEPCVQLRISSLIHKEWLFSLPGSKKRQYFLKPVVLESYFQIFFLVLSHFVNKQDTKRLDWIDGCIKFAEGFMFIFGSYQLSYLNLLAKGFHALTFNVF